jgi:hypothetical protein
MTNDELMTNDEGMNQKAVIPSEVEESRGEILKEIPRDPSTALRSAQDDCDFDFRASSFFRHSFGIRHYV